MKSRAEQEWSAFEANFHKYADRRIVLYGIGRGTATLVSENKCFKFVGLMDREAQNIGKNMYGLPIMSLSEAEKAADMIIISAPETYWEIIYKRIVKSTIPVYFRNGEKAHIAPKNIVTMEQIEKKLEALSVDDISATMIANLCKELFHQQKEAEKNFDEVKFHSLYSFGYCLWGPIVYTFCEWLYWKSKEKGVCQLAFLSRDGYLLQKDYDFFVQQKHLTDAPTSQYLLTSRRIAFAAAIESLESFQEWANFSFNGTFAEYMWNRFMVDVNGDEHAGQRIQMPHDRDEVQQWFREYELQIRRNIKRDKDNYKKYLEGLGLKDNFALVDIGYTGNIQRKLSHILRRQLTGFYFVCDLSPDNACLCDNELVPCFQRTGDNNADETAIYRRPQLLEAMFTAPYGMVMAVNEFGEKICMPPSTNQMFWEERTEINRGIQAFIHDMGNIKGSEKGIEERRLLADQLFGILINHIRLSPAIEKIFYWEDAIVQMRENMIFQ